MAEIMRWKTFEFVDCTSEIPTKMKKKLNAVLDMAVTDLSLKHKIDIVYVRPVKVGEILPLIKKIRFAWPAEQPARGVLRGFVKKDIDDKIFIVAQDNIQDTATIILHECFHLYLRDQVPKTRDMKQLSPEEGEVFEFLARTYALIMTRLLVK